VICIAGTRYDIEPLIDSRSLRHDLDIVATSVKSKDAMFEKLNHFAVDHEQGRLTVPIAVGFSSLTQTIHILFEMVVKSFLCLSSKCESFLNVSKSWVFGWRRVNFATFARMSPYVSLPLPP
jgi:hypothetical protein